MSQISENNLLKYFNNTIFQVPLSITIKKNSYGYGLFSNTIIKKDDIIYSGVCFDCPNDDTMYNLTIQQGTDILKFNEINKTHSVKITDTERQLYTFDGFINHCCEPNTISTETLKCNNNNTNGIDSFEYNMIATKNINIGEELTCNYLLFDYECDGHSFDCCCEKDSCFKFINGFKNCTFTQQLNLLPNLDRDVLNLYKNDNSNMIIIDDIKCPTNLRITSDDDYFSLISCVSFKIGDIVLNNQTKKIPLDTQVILNINNKYVLLERHAFSTQKDHKVFFGFESFTNHSCNPNCEHIELTDDTYLMIAIRDINIGDEITCDYLAFDPENECEAFECRCNEACCKKIIK
jgi:hypothetical protein